MAGCREQGGAPAPPVVPTPTEAASNTGVTATTADTTPPVPNSDAHFTDVAQAAGLNYQWSAPGKRPLTILQTIGNGCAFLDYNNDGNLDILLIGPKLALYQGDGHGHFTDVTHLVGLDKLQGYFLGCAVGDYDNDGYDDIYISAYRGGALLHNEHGKGFKEVTREAGIPAQAWGTSCAFADLDGTGRLSLYIGDYVDFGPKTSPQLCDNSQHMTSCGPRYYQPLHGHLYRNSDGGKFADVTEAWGGQSASGKALGVAFGDYNGSGHLSLYLANDEVAGDLLQNSGHRFTNIGSRSGTAYDSEGNAHGGMGADWGDYDNDGKLDLAVGTFQHEAKCVYHNDGHDFFTENSGPLGLADKTAPYVTFGTKFFDYNNDGWLDLILANGHVQDNISDIDKSASYKEPTLLFRNENGTHFTDMSTSAGQGLEQPIVGRGLAVGDFDNDGKVDLLVVDSEGKPLLLHNESSPVGHWAGFKLVGTGRSNRDAYGARVTVFAGGRKLLRICHTDGSYLSASDARVHVGLGTAAQIDQVRIQWPDGKTETWKNVPLGRYLTVTEGKPPQ